MAGPSGRLPVLRAGEGRTGVTLEDAAARHPDIDLYVVRPSIVLGPHAVGAKDVVPQVLVPLVRRLGKLTGGLRRLPVPVPAPVPDLPVQFVHEDDVGQALVACAVGAGPPGTYNLAGDGVLRGPDIARELGLAALPVPGGPVRAAARAVAALPFLPQVAGWVEVLSQPVVMDTSKAKRELGWRPSYTGLEALRATLGAGPS